LQPRRRRGGQRFQRGPQRLGDQLQPVELPHRSQHVGGIGALPPTTDQQPPLPKAVKHPVQQPLGLALAEQPRAELAQHRGVNASVGKLQAPGVLPVDPAADRVGGLAVRQSLGELPAPTPAPAAPVRPPGGPGPQTALGTARPRTAHRARHGSGSPGIPWGTPPPRPARSSSGPHGRAVATSSSLTASGVRCAPLRTPGLSRSPSPTARKFASRVQIGATPRPISDVSVHAV